MSKVVTTTLQLGASGTPANNFELKVPGVPDGTLTLERSDGTDILTVAASGQVSIPGGFISSSFTPTILGGTSAGVGTYTTQLGHYVQFGNLVFFEVFLAWTAHTGTGVMLMSVSELPILNASVNSVPLGVLTNGFAAGADRQLSANLNSSTKQVEFYAYDPAAGITSQPSIDTSVGVMRVSGTCRAF